MRRFTRQRYIKNAKILTFYTASAQELNEDNQKPSHELEVYFKKRT